MEATDPYNKGPCTDTIVYICPPADVRAICLCVTCSVCQSHMITAECLIKNLTLCIRHAHLFSVLKTWRA